MVDIYDVMQKAKNAGASDVHITVGVPPKMRVNGSLLSVEGYDRLMPQDTLDVVMSIANEEQRRRFEDIGEYDMSFSIPALGRYRVNIFKQRGSAGLALRLVGTEIPNPEKLGVPKAVIDLHERKRGLVLVTGSTKTATLISSPLRIL